MNGYVLHKSCMIFIVMYSLLLRWQILLIQKCQQCKASIILHCKGWNGLANEGGGFFIFTFGINIVNKIECSQKDAMLNIILRMN